MSFSGTAAVLLLSCCIGTKLAGSDTTGGLRLLVGNFRPLEVELLQAMKPTDDADAARRRNQIHQVMTVAPQNRALIRAPQKLVSQLAQDPDLTVADGSSLGELLGATGCESAEKTRQIAAFVSQPAAYRVSVDVGDAHRSEVTGTTLGELARSSLKFSRDFIVKVQHPSDGSILMATNINMKLFCSSADGVRIDEGEIYDRLTDGAVEKIAKALHDRLVKPSEKPVPAPY